MNTETIEAAIAEARRFIARAEILLKARKNIAAKYQGYTKYQAYACPREQGATKRASLDLTRALSAMRARAIEQEGQ